MSGRRAQQSVAASTVLEALRAGPFRGDGYAWLYEVRNGTGWRQQDRYADALAVSCWPSRGIFIAGIEVKVSRSDWKRELDAPEKSAEIQKFCSYWWVAAPVGVVELGELPETWGLMVVDGKKVMTAKSAPKLEAEPLTLTFVASVLRNASQAQEAARVAGRDSAWTEAHDAVSEERISKLVASVDEANREKRRFEQLVSYRDRDMAHLKSQIALFERTAGLPEGSIASNSGYMGRHPIAEQFKTAQALATHRPGDIVAHLRQAIEALEALDAAQKGAA